MSVLERLNQAQDLYMRGEYDQGLALLVGEITGEVTPVVAGQFYNFKMCMAALTGKDELALDLFEQAVDLGLWWTEEYLHSDPDLKSLQGTPRFERLVAVCEERYQQALEEARPELVVLPPAEGASPPYPMLFAIHGRMNNAADFSAYWESLPAQGWLVALPQSSQVTGPGSFIWDDDRTAMTELRLHFAALLDQHSIDRRRIVWAGFSQGGGLAARLALDPDVPGSKFLLVCPWMPDVEQLASGGALDSEARGFFVLGGRDDSGEVADQIRSRVEALGVPHRVETHPELGHDFPEDFERSLNVALDYLLAGESGDPEA